MLRIVAFALPFLATLNVLNGALRGRATPDGPGLIVLVGYLGIRLPLTYWLTLPDDRRAGSAWASGGPGSRCSSTSPSGASWSPPGSSRAAGRRRGSELGPARIGSTSTSSAARRSRTMAKRRSRFEVRKTDWTVGRELAEAELAAGAVDPPLEQDQLAQERAGDQVDAREVEDDPDRLAVVGQGGAELVGDLADRPVVEEQAVAERDDLDAVRLGDLDTQSGGHRGLPTGVDGRSDRPSDADRIAGRPANAR